MKRFPPVGYSLLCCQLPGSTQIGPWRHAASGRASGAAVLLKVMGYECSGILFCSFIAVYVNLTVHASLPLS